MFSALLVATLGLVGTPNRVQEPVEMLTLELRASRCSVALAEISKLTHLSLEASPQVANEIVLISVKNMPVRPLLTKLAYVVSGQWKQDGNVFRLSADNDRRRVEGIREVETKRQAVRNSLLKRAEQSAKMSKLSKDTKPAEQAERAMDFQISPEDLLVRILQGVNLAEASTIEEGDRLVYSTQPTRMQRPLPNGTMATVNQMVTTHNARIGETTKADVEDAMAGQNGGEMPEFMKEIMARQTRKVTGPISKANLVFQSTPFGMGVSATLNVYDTKGNVALSEQTALNGGFMDSFLDEMDLDEKGAPKKAVAKGTPIEFSEESKAFAKFSQGGMFNSGSFLVKMDLKLRQRVMNPVALEPLSLAATDCFMSLAKKRGKPIIASIPDSIFPSAFGRALSNTVESFELQIGKGEVANIVADPDYLLVMPSRPAENRIRRADRSALATLLSAVNAKSFPSLDDLATYAAKSSPPSSNPLTQSYLSLFAPGTIMQGFSGFTNWTMLRFYGQLPQGQRSTLMSGGRIPFGQLGPDATASLHRLVYGGGNLDVERPSSKPKSDDFFSKMVQQFSGMGGTGVDFKDEPTESLPNGLPPGGMVELTNSVGPLLLPLGKEGEMATFGLGAEELGMFKMMKDTPAFKESNAGGEDALKLPEQAKIGTRTSLKFVFRLVPGISLSETLQDLSMPKDSRIVSFSSLPADIQRQIDAEFEKLKKSPMAAMMAMGSMGRPAAPPPR